MLQKRRSVEARYTVSVGTKTKLGHVCCVSFSFFFFGQGDKKETRTDGQRARGGETWELGINSEKNPTGGSCSVAGASLTSFSQSVTPFPPGPWGCTLQPASLCPEQL